LLLLPI